MSDNAISLVQVQPAAIMPVMDIQAAMYRRQALIDYTRQLMVPGRDFGVVPGTGTKPTLLKPGAEKLCSLFGLAPSFEQVGEEMDWTGEAHGGEPFFYIQYKCRLSRGDMVVGEGLGSCNSWEKKYRYRQGERLCPACGKATIVKGKAEYGGGWLCFGKKGGCGAKFQEGDRSIEGQEVGQVKNPDAADVVNTIDKMAQKRALIAATLIAVNASEFYTQDVEDYAGDIIEGSYTEATGAAVTPPPPPPTGKATNGKAPAAAQRPATVTEYGAIVSHERRAYCANGDTIKNGALRAFDAYVAQNGHTPDSADELRAWAAHFKAEQEAAAKAAEAPVATAATQDDLFGEKAAPTPWEDPA